MDRMDELKRANSGLFDHSRNFIEVFNQLKNDKTGVENDILMDFQVKYLKKIKLVTSKSSFCLDDLEGFVYGPFTSRFWLMRKHMIQMTKKSLMNRAPFYAWDCITLQIKNKGDLYLIIKNEEVMNMFLKLLIYEMQTLDGNRGTAKQFTRREKQFCVSQTADADFEILSLKDFENMARHRVMLKVFKSFQLLKIR